MSTPSESEFIDELYCTPGMPGVIRAQQRRHFPDEVARVEKVAAQVEDYVLNTLGRRDGVVGAGLVTWQSLPAWVRLQILDVALKWSRGQISTCRHSPDPTRPDPVVVGLWRPDLVSCPLCSAELLRLVGDPDRTCDGCGRIVAGPEAGDPIYPTTVTHGPMMISWGACGDCFTPPPKVPSSGTSRKRRGKAARWQRGT